MREYHISKKIEKKPGPYHDPAIGIKMKVVRTNSMDPDFKALCLELDNELNQRYGRSQEKYDRHNLIEENQTVLVGYIDVLPVAGGCFKALDKIRVEIKRMFVRPGHRRMGLSTAILASLEAWALELGYAKALLETGKGQPEAIGLYRKQGYGVIDNYGPYAGMDNSVCMEKSIHDPLGGEKNGNGL